MRDRLAEWAQQAPDAAYLLSVTGTDIVRRRDVLDAVARWQDRLDAEGVPAGAPVTLREADPLRFACAYLGVVAAGRVAVPVDPAAPPAEVNRIERIASTVPAAPGGGVLLCTSGTTGDPKGILLSPEQLLHVASCVVAAHRLTPDDRGFNPLPLFHINAQVVGLLSTIVSGGSLVLDDRFHRTGFWERVAERSVTWVNAVPGIITVLAQTAPAPPPVTQVRFVRSASAPLPAEVLRRFEDAYRLPVVETYGMTEAASQITATPLDGPRKPGSAGVAVGVELQVVDAEGRECPAGQVGQVRIRGRGVITSYAAGGEGRVDADGWLSTGDLGRLDDDGYLFLAGRTDDVINRGGELVYPREVEELLAADPAVALAVVVGLPDATRGELPVAFVVPRPGAPEDLAARLAGRCTDGLSPYKRPVEIRVVERVPTGPNGKVRRHELVKQAVAGGQPA